MNVRRSFRERRSMWRLARHQRQLMRAFRRIATDHQKVRSLGGRVSAGEVGVGDRGPETFTVLPGSPTEGEDR